jgi:D-aminopeptidase
MEGVAGVVHEDRPDPIDPRHAGEYNRFRRLMTGEASAAVEALWHAGDDYREVFRACRALYSLAGAE